MYKYTIIANWTHVAVYYVYLYMMYSIDFATERFQVFYIIHIL